MVVVVVGGGLDGWFHSRVLLSFALVDVSLSILVFCCCCRDVMGVGDSVVAKRNSQLLR